MKVLVEYHTCKFKQIIQIISESLFDSQIAFGKVFVNAEPDYDWWMIDDEYGRDPAVRYLQSSLTFHPQDMLIKRIERGEKVDVTELYEGLRSQLQEIIEGGVDGA